ncbi:hypothetical protein ACSBR2_026791 [Camellia fascicularis]
MNTSARHIDKLVWTNQCCISLHDKLLLLARAAQLHFLSSCYGLLSSQCSSAFCNSSIKGIRTYPHSTHTQHLCVLPLLVCFYIALPTMPKSDLSENHRHQTYDFIARRGMVCFGWLVVVSLASILLPNSLGPPLYFLYILFLAVELLHRRLQMLWNWVHQIIVSRVPLMLPSRLIAHHFSKTGVIPRLHTAGNGGFSGV